MKDRVWLEQYDEGVPKTIDYPHTDLYSLMEPVFRRPAENPAIQFMGTTLSYQILFQQVERLAAALYRRGIQKTDRVVLLMPNCPQMVIAYYALMRLGAVAVMANPLNVERELLFKFKDSGAKAVIALDLMSQKLNKITGDLDLEFLLYTSLKEYLPFPLNLLYPLKTRLDKKMPRVEIIWGARTLAFSSLVKETNPEPPRPDIDPEDMAVLIYSGGTTGLSKGIMLSHRALIANLMQVCAWGNVEDKDAFLAVLPLFHGFGMSVCMNAPISLGGRLVLLPRFDAREVVKAISKYRPTLFAGVPTMFIAIKELQDIRTYDLTSLRGIFVGAAPLSLGVMKEFEEMTGSALIEGYGLTEAVTAVSCNPFKGTKKPGTIGIPFPDVEWRVVDLMEGKKDMPIGEPGEIVLRCPEMMTGYLNQPEKTSEVLRDGWIFTGDIGIMDEQGYITLVDRKKDLIIVSGFNVFPSEIDEILHDHPKVAEGVAVGLPHPKKGEYIKAYVVPKRGQEITPEEIIAFCRENLSAYMAPKEVEVREELPKSMIGKVLRRALREEEEKKWTEGKV
jgi:long-chain acyl-CoA synthetase